MLIKKPYRYKVEQGVNHFSHGVSLSLLPPFSDK